MKWRNFFGNIRMGMTSVATNSVTQLINTGLQDDYEFKGLQVLTTGALSFGSAATNKSWESMLVNGSGMPSGGPAAFWGAQTVNGMLLFPVQLLHEKYWGGQ